MFRRTLISIFIIPGLFCISCGSHSGQNSSASAAVTDTAKKIETPHVHHFRKFETGKVISHIKSAQDTNETWSLYLPKDYDTTKSWQVVYFLDAHARGTLPLKKYKDLADKYKMIFIGSDNSQNGLKQEAYDKIVDDMILSSQDLLNIDEKTVTLAGFSGGAKVAGAAAIRKGNISSVIGCAAPMSIDNIGSSYFNYYGIAGKWDFNYWDMVDLDQQFARTPLKHQLLTFEGKHEWPDVNTMDEAIFLVTANEMKNKTRPVDADMVDAFFSMFTKKEAEAVAKHNYMEMYNMCNLVASNFDGLKDVKIYAQRLDSLRSSAGYAKAVADNQALRKSEVEAKGRYMKGFQDPNFNWNSVLPELTAQKSGDISATERNKRLAAFVNMLSYLRTTELLNGNHLEDAARFLKIFKATDVKNPDGPYLTADYYALKGDKVQAFASLNEAIKMGYDDLAHFSTDPMLVSLKSDPGYARIYQKLAKG